MKKIINNVDAVENEMVLGMAKAYPQYIKKLDCGNVVVRARKKEGVSDPSSLKKKQT